MKRWEYLFLSIDDVAEDGKSEADFDIFGAAGWELVDVIAGNPDRLPHAVFKRRLAKKLTTMTAELESKKRTK